MVERERERSEISSFFELGSMELGEMGGERAHSTAVSKVAGRQEVKNIQRCALFFHEMNINKM